MNPTRTDEPDADAEISDEELLSETTRTDEELRDFLDEYCPISTRNVNIDIDQIIYRKLIINPANPNASTYKDIFVPRAYVGEGAPFRALLRQIAKYGYTSHNYDREEDHPLDIAVYLNSIIIVQLPPNSGYWFQAPGIWLRKTSSGQCPTDRYGQLRYVDGDGDWHERPPANCTMLYFRAEHYPGTWQQPYIQGFQYEVPTLRLPFVRVDPDIRHPGNGDSTPEQ
jgi:hypothetical protein